MHVERSGNGDAVFLGIHGWAGNHRTFRTVAENPPATVTFYSVDLPGYGKSRAPQVWDLVAIADELVEVIGRIPAKSLTLAGYCGGGNLALMVAQRVPDRVSRLVLIDPFAYMPWYFRLFTWGNFGKRAYYFTFAGKTGRWITNSALGSKRSGDTDLTRSFANVDHQMTLQVLRSFTRFPSYATFAGLSVEIDIIYGERSFRAVKESAQLWKTVLPEARLHEIPGVGHSPLQEAPDAMRTILFDYPRVAPSALECDGGGATGRFLRDHCGDSSA